MNAQHPEESRVRNDSNPPMPIGPDRRFVMTWKTFLVSLGVASVCTASWISIKLDVADHGKQLAEVSIRLKAIETDVRAANLTVFDVRSDQRLLKQSVDYLVNDRRGPKPTTGTASTAP